MRPGVAGVSGFVNSEPSLRITRGIWLAGSSVERVISRIEGQRANRIGREAAGDKRPGRPAAG